MARLRPLEQGSISYAGKDVSTTPTAELAKTLSILTQENSVMSRITVRDLLMFGRYPYHQGRPTPEDLAIVENALSEFKLDSFANRYLTELSGGQRQRLALARALLCETPIMILDEATSQVDRETEARVLAGIRRRTSDKTLIVVAHRLDTIRDADQIIVMDSGRIVEVGTWDQLYESGGALRALADREEGAR